VVRDFGIAPVSDATVLHAAITPQNGLEVCSWEAAVGLGELTRTGCLSEGVNDLEDGTGDLSPARVEVSRLSTLESEGDFLSGHLNGTGVLVLRLWRIAPRPNEG